MCDCKKNLRDIKNPSNCKNVYLSTLDVLSIPINVDNNNLIKEIVLSAEENFVDITILKNLFNYQKINDEKILIIKNYDLHDIINYPKKFSDIKPPVNLKKLFCILLKKTCYTYNVLINLFVTINEESTKKIINYYKKFIETKNIDYICRIVKIINEPKNYKNSKYVVEINCEIYTKFLNFIKALNTREYVNNIKISFSNTENFNSTFYTIQIPDYIKNFSQIKKFIQVLFDSKEIFKQLNEKSTIYNISIPSTSNGKNIVYDSYNNFISNDYYNYIIENNIQDGSYSFNPYGKNSYFNQKIPKKMFPVN